MDLVTCTHCREAKGPAEFRPEPRKRNGLSSWCKDCGRGAARDYKKRNPQVAVPGYARDYYRAKCSEALQLLGGRCVRCGFDDERALQIDHIDAGNHVLCPGGRKYRYAVHRSVIDGTASNLQLLCANCHAIKTLEAGDHLARHAP